MARDLKVVTNKRQQKWYDDHIASIACGYYQPFWRCQDVRSSGIKVKVPHFSDPYRVVHLLSMNEMLMYMQLAWDKTVSEVYEQFALPLEETTAIAHELDVKHPVYIDSKTPIIQTIDFVCVRKDGTKTSYAVKQASWLDDYRTQEKLAIQEGWCEINDIKFETVSSDDLKTIRCQNLEFLFYHRKLDQFLFGAFRTWLSNFFGELSEHCHDRTAHILERSAELTGLPYQRAAQFFYHSIWIGWINFDWHQPLALELPASDLEVMPNDARIKKLR
jgi:hypothetical protein